MHPCRGGLQRTPGRGSVVSAAHWKNRDSRQRYDSLLLRARGRYEALACVMLAGASFCCFRTNSVRSKKATR